MQFPKVSVIVLNYNGKNFIRNCLKSLLLTNYPNFEVLFVDNSSTDGSREWLEEELKKLKLDNFKLIPLDKNYGFAKGNNIGIALSDPKSELIVLLNNDTEVEPDWLAKLVNFMQEHKEVGVAQCKLMSLKNKQLIDSAGGAIDQIGRVYIIGRELEGKKFKISYEIFYAQGAAIAIRREILKRIGLLDEDYFIYYEETDLCWRAWLNGVRVAFVPDSVVYHYGSGATFSSLDNSPNPFIVYNNRKNQICTLFKNYSLKNLIKSIPYLYFVDTALIIKFLIRKQPKCALALIFAMLWPIVHMKSLLYKRKIVQRYIRKVSDEEILKKLILRRRPKISIDAPNFAKV
jgi:GT2 family glycosyltransferase